MGVVGGWKKQQAMTQPVRDLSLPLVGSVGPGAKEWASGECCMLTCWSG